MLGLKCSRKASYNANGVGLGHHDICHSPRIFTAHAGYHEIDTCSSDLGLINGNLANFVNSQISKLSPRGEFGFDGECDEDAHYLNSDAALKGSATNKAQVSFSY